MKSKHPLGNERRPIYPFTAIIAQDEFKTALTLNAIDPTIGGVLLTGPKGTGKSTIVRASEEIFPEIYVAEDCIFGCNPLDQTKMCKECCGRFYENETIHKRKKRRQVVTLPLSATEDRVIGSIDLEIVLRKGMKAIQPGILAEANQNILYIDEVNLLPDHLVDTILDASASGWNIIEREGVSMTHPSNFVLIGSMNPEEGELRPQILDRFGLHAKAQRLFNPNERIEIVKRNEEFNKNPPVFIKKYESQQEELKQKINIAKENLPRVQVPQSILKNITATCDKLHVDGYRPDIVMFKAARAMAALNNREKVIPDDVYTVSNFALSHRTRNLGRKPPPTTREIHKALILITGKDTSIPKIDLLKKVGRQLTLKVRMIPLLALLTIFVLSLTLLTASLLSIDIFVKLFSSLDLALFFTAVSIFTVITLIIKMPKRKKFSRILDLARITAEQMSGRRVVMAEESQNSEDSVRTPSDAEVHERKADVENGKKVFTNLTMPPKPTEYLKKTKSQEKKTLRGRNYLVGKHAPVVTSLSHGRYVWHELPKEKPWDIAFGPTIRAAAPYQKSREVNNLALVIEPQDIRVKMREYRAPFSIVILVDLSLSMVGSIVNLGKAILTLHKSVYRRRDRVGLVVFKGEEAYVLQKPTTKIDTVVKRLWRTGASDFTPMAAGMLKSWRILRREKQRNKDSIPMLIIVSDGLANIPLKHPLSKRSRKSLLSHAQADTMDAAKLLARDNIRTIVINTAHRIPEALQEEFKITSIVSKKLFNPTKFLMEISRVAKGSYYGLLLKQEDEVPFQSEKRRLGDWFYIGKNRGGALFDW